MRSAQSLRIGVDNPVLIEQGVAVPIGKHGVAEQHNRLHVRIRRGDAAVNFQPSQRDAQSVIVFFRLFICVNFGAAVSEEFDAFTHFLQHVFHRHVRIVQLQFVFHFIGVGIAFAEILLELHRADDGIEILDAARQSKTDESH